MVEGSWTWIEDSLHRYTVKSTYCYLFRLRFGIHQEGVGHQLFNSFWKCLAPVKVQAFSWRLLLDRLLMRVQLFRRGILQDPHAHCCVFCFLQLETRDHLFFSCNFSYQVWSMVLSLARCFSVVLHNIGVDHYLHHSYLIRGKSFRKSRYVIWHAVTWSLWLMRNSMIFSIALADFTEILHKIKLCSWNWFIAKIHGVHCSFSNWCINPLSYMVQVFCWGV